MKRITLLSILVFFTAFSRIKAQQNKIEESIQSQYQSKIHQSFIYQVSPQSKVADELLKKNYLDFQNSLSTKPEAFSAGLSADTSWGYSETKLDTDSMFIPYDYTQYFLLGDTSEYVTYYNSFIWSREYGEWNPSSLQSTWTKENFNDSTQTLYYQNHEDEPYYGAKNRYVKEPTEGADYEYYRDDYDPNTGWTKYLRELRYRNEEGYDTLTKSYIYDEAIMQYTLESTQRWLQNSKYELEERKFWLNGTLNDWSWDYLKIGDEGQYIYQVSKRYDGNGGLVGEDSLHYYYKDGYTEAKQFEWNYDDSSWDLTQFYRSYEREFEGVNNGYVVDSVIVYSLILNESSGEYEIGPPSVKNEMFYDVSGNQIEVKNYTRSGDKLELQSRVVRTFRLLGTYYAQVKQESYGKDWQTGELYKGSVSENIYGDDFQHLGSKQFNLSAAGDTTYGYSSETRFDEDGTRYEISFQWNNEVRALLLNSYRIYRTLRSEGGSINQSYTIEKNRKSRRMNGYNKVPGVFNDGPLFVNMGDTLSLYISGRNANMSIPKLTVTDMPATATYDEETRHFYWIVDEVNPSPMIYTATSADKSISTKVEFRTELFMVDNENEDFRPEEFKLSQNYPNPFNPTTNITFILPEAGVVSLKMYNILGQEVSVLINRKLASGAHTIAFDAGGLSSGIYIYRLQAGNLVQTRKMTLIK